MNEDSSTPLLEVRSLRCERVGRLLFEDVDFILASGGILQVAGPNGCGKTTMLRTLAGLSERCTGAILWRGQPLVRARYEYLSETLYLGHDAAVKPALTPRENLRWHAGLWGKTRPIGPDRALAQLGLAPFLDTPARNLSAGQQRRIALARLLLSPARLWILDEPFTAIDFSGVTQLETLIVEHAASGGAVLLTTHHQLALGREVQQLDLGQAGGH